MNKNFSISEGKTFDEALSNALAELGCSRENVEIETIESGKKVLGIRYKNYILKVKKKVEKKIEIKQDGFFDIFYREDGVYLTVFRPTGGGQRVKFEEVMQTVKNKRIEDADIGQIKKAISDPQGGTFRFAKAQEKELIDGEVEINIRNDKMSATIVLYPPDGGKDIEFKEVMNVLASNGIVKGIDEERIKKAIDSNEVNKEILIAEGRNPINGEDAELKLEFDVIHTTVPKLMEDGRVDYRSIGSIANVKAGQPLATITQPTIGEAGYTVTGEAVEQKKGKDIPVPIGKNVEYIEQERKIISKIEGKAEYKNGKIDVMNLLDIDGDLNMSVGNVNFAGDVLVRGNVLMGFKLIASGSIEIFGVVEGAEIEAGGDVILRQGIQGMEKGKIKCKGNFVARFVENADIEVEGHIRVDSIMHSNIKCGDKVFVSGKKGLIVGGSVWVSKDIVAKILGSPTGTITDVKLGVLPEVRTKYDKLIQEIKQIETDKEEIEKTIKLIEKIETKSNLTQDKKTVKFEANKRKIMLEKLLGEKKYEYKVVEKKINSASDSGVHVSGITYPGVRIMIGSAVMNVYDRYEYSTFVREGLDVSVREYSGSEVK